MSRDARFPCVRVGEKGVLMKKSFQDWINKDIADVSNKLAARLDKTCSMCSTEGKISMSIRNEVYAVLDDLLEVLFPGCYGRSNVDKSDVSLFVGNRLRTIAASLGRLLEYAYRHRCQLKLCGDCDCEGMAEETTIKVIEALPDIHSVLMTDIQAAYDGDPAAISYNEVVMSYPFIEAIATHRIAHVLYDRKVPLIPRIMSERAHSNTGIDIHPGATIGRRFFIDHGTGVVIGETTVIGENVKIYQGVTLGALSFPKDEQGNPVKGVKRHPNIEDDVVIYAETTILGGETTVGRGSVIGGNVWLTQSVPPYSKVYNDPPVLRFVNGKGEERAMPVSGDGARVNPEKDKVGV